MARGQGRGQGKGQGRGQGQGAGQGRGRGLGGGSALGPGGECMCPNCGYKTSHQIGVPCYNQRCPKCETMMVRT
jgi:hypothetical protein